MSACPFIDECIYFSAGKPDDTNIRALREAQKEHYCAHGGEGCARHAIALKLGMKSVPDDLLPHEVERAEQVFARAKWRE